MRACTMGVPPSKYRSPACSTCALALMCASLSGSVRPGQAWLVRHWSTSRRRARIADPQWHHSRMIPPVSCSLSAGPVMASHFCTVFCLIIEQSAQCQGTKKGAPVMDAPSFVMIWFGVRITDNPPAAASLPVMFGSEHRKLPPRAIGPPICCIPALGMGIGGASSARGAPVPPVRARPRIAEPRGIEPRPAVLETAVLPLHHVPLVPRMRVRGDDTYSFMGSLRRVPLAPQCVAVPSLPRHGGSIDVAGHKESHLHGCVGGLG